MPHEAALRRPRRRLAALLIALLAGLATAAISPSLSAAADEHMGYSADGQWRADIHAWTTNLWLYKSIGARVWVQHREWGCTAIFCIDGKRWRWVDREASSIDIGTTYTPWPPSGTGTCPPDNCVPPAPPQRCHADGRQSLECYQWGVMFTFDPDSRVPGRAQLNARAVTASATVRLADGQSIALGPVDNAFWF